MTRLARRLASLAAVAVALLTTASTPASAVAAPESVAPAATAYSGLSAAPSGVTCTTLRRHVVNLTCVIGKSVDRRPIVAARQGNPAASRVLVVVGQMHGEEWAGPLTVDTIRRIPVAATASYVVWTVRTMNPDGGAIGRRRNSHGVDLNRNFPASFVRLPDSGRRPLSEPESSAMARFLTWIQPDLVISLHGFSTAVDTTGGGRRASLARQFSALSGITPAHPVPCDGPCHGNMTDWYVATSTTGGVAFTVEMPRTSKATHACGVPGVRRATTITCSAYAAVKLASTLPR